MMIHQMRGFFTMSLSPSRPLFSLILSLESVTIVCFSAFIRSLSRKIMTPIAAIKVKTAETSMTFLYDNAGFSVTVVMKRAMAFMIAEVVPLHA